MYATNCDECDVQKDPDNEGQAHKRRLVFGYLSGFRYDHANLLEIYRYRVPVEVAQRFLHEVAVHDHIGLIVDDITHGACERTIHEVAKLCTVSGIRYDWGEVEVFGECHQHVVTGAHVSNLSFDYLGYARKLRHSEGLSPEVTNAEYVSNASFVGDDQLGCSTA